MMVMAAVGNIAAASGTQFLIREFSDRSTQQLGDQP